MCEEPNVTSAAMHQFTYEPLNLVQHSFRLVRLVRGSGGPIECELFHARVHDAYDSIDYEALSYTWGSALKSHNVNINSSDLAVTKNLHEALWHLRDKDEDRILWIDAICINQDDQKERGHQVQQMASIYESARQVIIWLGQAASGTDSLFDLIRALERQALNHACNNWSPSDNRWQFLWATATVDKMQDDVATLRMYQCYENLLTRDWFKRVWVLQEVAKARAAKIACGTKSVSARFFALMPPLLGVRPEYCSQSVLDIMPGPSRKYSWWNGNRDLNTLLHKFSESQASDSRDRIYALLGISSDACKADILVPDYKKTEAEVIQSTVSFLIDAHMHGVPAGKLPVWSTLEFWDRIQDLPTALLPWARMNRYGSLAASLEGVLVAESAGSIRDSSDTYGSASLSWAAEHGNERSAGLALEKGADVNSRDWLNQTPLSLAAENGHAGVVKLLLDTGKAEVNTTDWRGRTPLAWAAGRGHTPIVRMLLDISEVNSIFLDKSGWTPLSLAIENSHWDIVELLQAHMQKTEDTIPPVNSF